MTHPPSIPETPQPPVLNYFGPSRARRYASGGLFLMGGALLFIFGGMFPFVAAAGISRGGPAPIAILIFLIVATWGAVYIACARAIRRKGNIFAAWLAIIMVGVQTIALGSICVIGELTAWGTDDWEYWRLVSFFLFIVAMGFGAVIFELVKVIRESRLPKSPYECNP